MHERQYLGLQPSSWLGWYVRLFAGYCFEVHEGSDNQDRESSLLVVGS